MPENPVIPDIQLLPGLEINFINWYVLFQGQYQYRLLVLQEAAYQYLALILTVM